jgi:putative nucleotidyltransferase with HDIG domain
LSLCFRNIRKHFIYSLVRIVQKEYALTNGVVKYLLRGNHREIFQEVTNRLNELYARGIVGNKPPEFRIITIVSGDKEMVESIDQLYSLTEAENVATFDQRQEYRNLIKFFLQSNITFSDKKTELRIDEVFANVPKTKGQILKGELIVEKHKRVTAEAMEKIIALEKTYISIGTWEILRIIIFRNILFLAMILLLYHYDKITKSRMFKQKSLYLIVLLSTIYLVIGKITYATNTIYLLPIAFFIFICALYFNLYASIIITIIFAAVFSFTLNSIPIFIYLFVSGIVAAFSIQTIDSRLSLYRPLLYVAVANVVTILFIDMYLLKGNIVVLHVGLGVLNSILASVSLALLLPLFEKIFDFTTDLTLLELGNLNLPLFKEMAIEAAGTYHHSIVVGNLAEAGANAIGADPILARVGAYYHDIGKLKKPDYFIENQIGVKNPHDNLKPQMSVLVIISHVKDGIEMAKKMKLPKKLIDIIEQHHGTTTIELFYRKALHISVDTNQDSFRYPGPKPKTKEAALVMLADSIEASARSDKTITITKLQRIVKDSIARKFDDGQLDDCPIARSDLVHVSTAFLPILTGIFHPRIDYDSTPSH